MPDWFGLILGNKMKPEHREYFEELKKLNKKYSVRITWDYDQVEFLFDDSTYHLIEDYDNFGFHGDTIIEDRIE